MITLPTPVRRHWASAFATVATVFLGVFGGAVTWGTSLPMGPIPGAVAGLALGGALHVSQPLRVIAYRAWASLARKVSNLVARYVTRLLFGVVTLAGRGGSSFAMGPTPRATSNWTPKHTVLPENYESQHVGTGGNRSSWTGSYLSWGIHGSGIWVWAIYPLVALLGFVQTQEKGSFGGNVYTLY